MSCSGGACSEQFFTSTGVTSAPLPSSYMPCYMDSVCVCVSVSVFVQVWFCPLGESGKGLCEAHLLSYAPAPCCAADTVRVFSTVCFTFSPDQICMIKELETSHRAMLGTLVPQFWQDSQSSLQLQAAPVVWLFLVLNVVFSKNNL